MSSSASVVTTMRTVSPFVTSIVFGPPTTRRRAIGMRVTGGRRRLGLGSVGCGRRRVGAVSSVSVCRGWSAAEDSALVVARPRDQKGHRGHDHGSDDQAYSLVPRQAAAKYGNRLAGLHRDRNTPVTGWSRAGQLRCRSCGHDARSRPSLPPPARRRRRPETGASLPRAARTPRRRASGQLRHQAARRAAEPVRSSTYRATGTANSTTTANPAPARERRRHPGHNLYCAAVCRSRLATRLAPGNARPLST